MRSPCMVSGNEALQKQKIWIVFTGQTDRWWLRFLRPGFRHCFVIVNDGQGWLSLDPMLNHMEIQIHRDVPGAFDLPAWLRERGHHIVPGRMDHTHVTPAPFSFFSCVEVVKRILGLHKLFIFTPWQLYCHLQKTNKTKGDLSWEV